MNIFSRYVLNCEVSEDWNEAMASYVVSFLLDHYNELFEVPASLISQINAKLCQKSSSKARRPPRVCREFYYML